MNPGFAPAKVNLWLHVGRRRKDGYHEVASLIGFALDAGDILTAEPADELTLDVTGPEALALQDADNLVLKAARALARAADEPRPGARLCLEKRLPVASGLGGGSADAAAALRLLNRLWDLDWPLDRLERVAAEIGADVPVCVWSRPAAVEGIGERVDILSAWPELHAVLVNPRVPLATAEVFARFDSGGHDRPLSMRLPLGITHQEEALALIRRGANELEPPARELAPVVGDVLQTFENEGNCLLFRMSGSGASCFGLYESAQDASQAAARISLARPDWWVMPTRLAGCEDN